MKITIEQGQKLFPHGNFAPLNISITVEDNVKKGETYEEAYDRLDELQKCLFCKKVIETLNVTNVDPYLEKNQLLERIMEVLSDINIELLNKNEV